MKSLMQQALGEAWHHLPPSLQAHYLPGTTLDVGHLDIEYPAFMQPVLFVLSHIGALVRRRGKAVATQVEKSVAGERQQWRRTMCFADGTLQRFDSVWESGPQGHVVEFVNPWLGLQMQPTVVGQQLHYRGVRFVVRLGCWTLGIPEWLALGHTTIVEKALDERRFAMDFRLTHPVFGQVFRYSGEFEANAQECGQPDT
ncbi:MAG: DUF4166 domain-containing protein [Zoogloea sp.]|nr:DUF4166 domain-containing protein [Zoogloea sp.]